MYTLCRIRQKLDFLYFLLAAGRFMHCKLCFINAETCNFKIFSHYVEVTVDNKEEDFCPNYVQEFGL
jgi:hypothetical protein